MTIRFAAAWGGATPAITRALCPSAPLGAANDNRRTMALHDAACARTRIRATPQHDPHLLSEALRHFGRFGLGAAAQARSEAEQADRRGDREAREHWLAICRHLDRRMATACACAFSREG
ncbi:MAG: hypothetical protein CMH85_16385 [Novosphingobium sp.]|jgi:hypothetical protein|nr:hypothetical protein [Novosphingobium sp.]